MSYLGFPRLNFCGAFQADPSTVNNDPYHFNVAQFRPGWDEPGPRSTKGWWNPRRDRRLAAEGLHGAQRRLRRRDVERGPAQRSDGRQARERARPIGCRASSSTSTPSSRWSTELWGLQIRFAGGFGRRVRGRAFADIWIRFPKGQPDSFFSATYQSVLTDLDWAPRGASRFLQELGPGRRAEHQVHRRRLRRRRDLCDVHVRPHLRRDRPLRDGEPHHLVAGRLMRPLAPPPMSPQAANFAPFRIDGDRLFVDLGQQPADAGRRRAAGRTSGRLGSRCCPPMVRRSRSARSTTSDRGSTRTWPGSRCCG